MRIRVSDLPVILLAKHESWPMLFTPVVLLTAALLASGKLVIIDLALEPSAAKARPIQFDAAAVRAAIAYQLAQVGVPVAGGERAARLVVRITYWDPGNGIGLGQTARMTANYKLRDADGRESDVMAVSCEGKAALTLTSTPSERTRLAWNRCLTEFSTRIANGLVGDTETIVVR